MDTQATEHYLGSVWIPCSILTYGPYTWYIPLSLMFQSISDMNMTNTALSAQRTLYYNKDMNLKGVLLHQCYKLCCTVATYQSPHVVGSNRKLSVEMMIVTPRPPGLYTETSVSSSMTFVHNDLVKGKCIISLQFHDMDVSLNCKQTKKHARQMRLQNKTATCQ
jgi:hypothetical protein